MASVTLRAVALSLTGICVKNIGLDEAILALARDAHGEPVDPPT